MPLLDLSHGGSTSFELEMSLGDVGSTSFELGMSLEASNQRKSPVTFSL